MIDSIHQAWGTVDQESRRLSDIWLTVLNPSGGNSDKGLIIEKWESIKETKDSKTYRLEFKKECQGNIGKQTRHLYYAQNSHN